MEQTEVGVIKAKWTETPWARVALSSVVFLVAAGTASAQLPAGVIVFSHEDSGSSDPNQQFTNLWMMDPQNPPNQTPITSFTSAPFQASQPAWSKDYSHFAFNSNLNDGLNSLEASSVYSMNLDGSGLAQITGFGVLDPLPPPTGSVIGNVVPAPIVGSGGTAFGTLTSCLVSAQGATQTAECADDGTFEIDNVPGGSAWVRVQAQVDYLGFHDICSNFSLGSAAITVQPGGTTNAGTIQVARQVPSSLQPSWSMDGSQVAVTNQLDSCISTRDSSGNPILQPQFSFQIALWDAAGNFLNVIPDAPGYNYSSPDWSPLNNRIAFAAIGSSAGQSGVYTMDPDGGNIRTVYQVPLPGPFDPLRVVAFCRWSPDGQKIAFVQLSSPLVGAGWEDIYVINADGSGVTQIIRDNPGGFILALDWSPDSQAIVFEFDFAPDGFNIQTRDLWAVAGATLVQLTTDGRSATPAWGPGT